jgi:hypothetical protein
MPNDRSNSSRATGRWRLALCGLLVGLVWLVVFPWIAARPSVHARIEWLAERRIDPSAMYYTEVDAMQPILDRLNRRERGRR